MKVVWFCYTLDFLVGNTAYCFDYTEATEWTIQDCCNMRYHLTRLDLII